MIEVPEVAKVIVPSLFAPCVSIVTSVPKVTGPVIDTEALAVSSVVMLPFKVTPSVPVILIACI